MNTIQHGGNLYRRLNSDTFMRYNPVTDDFTFVPAMAVPALVHMMPTTSKTRSNSALNEEEQRFTLLLSTMLDYVISTHPDGDDDDRMLRRIAESLPDPASLVRLQRILHAEQEGFFAPEREHESRRNSPPAAAVNVSRARQILEEVIAGAPITREHLMELAASLPALPIVEIRRTRAIFDGRTVQAWGDAELLHSLRDVLLNQLHTTGSPV